MKGTITAIIISLALIGAVIVMSKKSADTSDTSLPANNVSIVDGKQIIEINARGGYQPRKSVARAGMPTVIRFNTTNTFDCSASVRIPSLNVSEVLPQTGVKNIDVGTQKIGTLQGSCGMGMYPFEVEFE
jgi:plastocyanin domain-containing protein